MPHTLWMVWVLGVIISLSKEESSDQASLSCDHNGICKGSSGFLNSIPSGLTEAVKNLDLSNNRITYISNSDLQRCVNLQALVLTSNGINTIEEDSFSSLGRLEHLDLSYNYLSNLSSSWFKPLSSLTFLNLLGNPYKTLGETSLFSHLTKLRILRVGNMDTFTKIQRKDFAGLTFLEELEIGASDLQSYEPKSLKLIQNVSHLILHMKQHILLLEIFVDLPSSVECLELRDTDLDTFHFSELTTGETNSLIKKFTFRNVKITDESLFQVMKLLSQISGLLELEFDDCTLNGIGDFRESDNDRVIDPGKVETLTIRRLHIPRFYSFNDLSTLYSLTERVKRITVENSKVFLVPCSLSQHLKSLEYLDLSENLMVEEYLKNSACEDAWPSLQTLILRQNHLASLGKTGETLLTLKNLTNLDISKNTFHYMPETCQWPEKMKYLNLSSARIHSVTGCIPKTLEILDISNNNLNLFSLNLPQLKELYISRNKLMTLPDASLLPMLLVLKISRNTITTFSKEQLDSFHTLKTLEAGGNNFICSCEFLSFTQEQQALAKVLVDWPANYLCDSPSHVRGQRVQDVRLSVSECHRAALVSGVCCALLLLILLMGVLCHRFHGLWYMKMMWAWLQAKRKPRKAPSRDICYDAFVSYSERDAYWVENLMVQELENFNPPFKLCLHKRDFIPGKWIIDNIIDSIEKSHKTVFVLSENFVKSEWCKYELDFSHFRLFDENNDAAILVLLEPIEKKAIPQRFCKLRKIMNTKTYLEWPMDEARQEGFWVNLRTAIKS
ncbi:toll-like receptor 2 [Rhinopithecus roxellana]|uniref:Toll-like receptor 2 n=2 Tax=Rhinopithecus TaxID=542827 RepID=A0AAJ7HCU9_RHIBE|nr:toll-like receptor 2 [Rhinopithecus roxellana]XP_017726577.1 PREDICTED: toll-like receptor 2 [Rhinopithecus bieti]XP_017726578.1 PREDICTED: toll-like receptor 2 [Rhinopithecus bieti]XP_017726579.1 PREDICTED: toll-like receptor 2 [Rhinopithecus bieti]XP_017726580.1 PREDICTED: toll-like receptor 2 [Rhinopithecus bieti]XP_030772448.1 toll-like receptor 2 [Rhinopithecus roxellana]XP_030772456.1 toll-like receptor 2 [Rhinopithecus roxellana]XP_030772467.1 toll-like receptor 2 [Rhinopithecus ro